MLAAFDQHYCVMGLNPEFDPIYPDTEYAGGYNASDCGVDKPTLVISISYAWNEAWYSERYLQRQCLEFLKLGLRGVTVIAASGDRGPADQRNLCIDPETGTANVSEGYFSSNFPASCPWVTGVGGTQLTPTNQSWVKGSRAFPPETALDTTLGSASTIVSSGGGFSNIFSAPFYQSAAVEAYLTQPEHRAHLANLSLSGYFNPHGRGYPDVSVVALNYLVFTNGNLRSGTGTSASTPVFASMIVRINDARLRAGKGPVGFVNAVLYAYQHKIMRDVETGSNTGCGVSEAFPAQEGWDAVTGLGSPDFEKLLDLYLHLP
jgi:tripeptidyl-peptidase I